MKNKKEKLKAAKKPETVKSISNRGIKVIFAGAVILAAGFFILSKTDPAGQNWASKLSPFLILGGYAAIGAGILVPERQEGKEGAKSPEKG
jgi:hypothetical protein